MKKFLALFFCLAMFTACSEDDDAPAEGEDKILGKWYLADITNSGSLNLEVNECTSRSFIEFFAEDNSSTSEFYSETEGVCAVESSDNSTWSNQGGGKYRFVIPYEGIGSQTGRVEFNGTSEFTFFPDLLIVQNTGIVFEKR